MTDTVRTVELGTYVIEGQKVAISVNEGGRFLASVGGADLQSDSLSVLKGQIRDTIAGARVNVPFVNLQGRAGMMRGFHATSRDVLVTWSNGEKGKLGATDRVFIAGQISHAKIEEIKTTIESIDKGRARLKELREGVVEAKAILAAAVGEDLFAYGRNRP